MPTGARAQWLLVTVAAQVSHLSLKYARPVPAMSTGRKGSKVPELTYVPRAGVIFWCQAPLETPASQRMGKNVNRSEPISTFGQLNTFLGSDFSARSWLPFMTLSFVSNLPRTGFRQDRAFDRPSPPPTAPSLGLSAFSSSTIFVTIKLCQLSQLTYRLPVNMSFHSLDIPPSHLGISTLSISLQKTFVQKYETPTEQCQLAAITSGSDRKHPTVTH